MRSLILLGAAALTLLSNAAPLSAQMVKQPGQLGTALRIEGNEYPSDSMPKITIANIEDSHARFVNRSWIASMLAVVAGTSFDAATSWGQPERNGLLASSDGTFGAKGLSIKAAFAAAVIVPQICLRKHSALKGVFAGGNFIEAAAFTGVSIHNLEVRNASTQ